MTKGISTSASMSKKAALTVRLKDPATRQEAFGEMVAEHQERLYYHVRRMLGNHEDADDVLQNTFIKAWKAIDRFRGDAKIHTWLYRIATNEALTAIERRKRRSFQDLEELTDSRVHSHEQTSTTTAEDIQQKLMEAIGTLPDRQRAVFNMRYFDEMPYEEISNILEVTVGSLKASYHHAVKKIEASLSQES